MKKATNGFRRVHLDRQFHELRTRYAGIDWSLSRAAFKPALAATIALACCRSSAWTDYFQNYGYFAPFASLVCNAAQPRAKFLQSMLVTIVLCSMTVAIQALAIFTVVHARSNFTEGYDSSASTVAAVWLVVETFSIATFVTKPELTVPGTACQIISTFPLIYCLRVTSTSAALLILWQIGAATYIGFAISILVSLLVFPSESRTPFYSSLNQTGIEIQRLLAWINLYQGFRTTKSNILFDYDKGQGSRYLEDLRERLSAQLKDAQQEIVWSKYNANDLEDIWSSLQDIIIPLTALGRRVESCDNTHRSLSSLDQDGDFQHDPTEHYQALLKDTEHLFSQSLILSAHGVACAVQSLFNVDCIDLTLIDSIITDLQAFQPTLFASKSLIRRASQEGHTRQQISKELRKETLDSLHKYMLIWAVSDRTLKLLMVTRNLYSNRHTSLQAPLLYQLRSLPGQMIPKPPNRARRKYVKSKKVDKPTPIVAILQILFNFFSSRSATTAFRIVFATMSIAIIAFLQNTQEVYIQYHLTWAQYAVGLVITRSAGQSVRNLMLRLLGTVSAILMAWISYYIVIGYAGGCIVFYGLFVFIEKYIGARYPDYSVWDNVTGFALTVILGLQLQDNKMAPDQPSLPVYELGALRAGVIVGGLIIAWLWTNFPYPISQHILIEELLGKCLYTLAEYHEASHELIRTKTTGHDDRDAISRLESLSVGRFENCMDTILQVKKEMKLVRYNLPVRGCFPKKQYKEAVSHIESILDRVRLLSFTTFVLEDFLNTTQKSAWSSRLQDLFIKWRPDTEATTTIYIVLSNSMTSGIPLPPHVTIPKNSFSLSNLGADVMDAQNMANPGFAPLHMIGSCASDIAVHTGKLLNCLKEVNGELDFSLDAMDYV